MLNASIHLIEKYNYLEEKFLKAYQWLRDHDATAMEPGTYPIDGDDLYAHGDEELCRIRREHMAVIPQGADLLNRHNLLCASITYFLR